MEGSGGVWAAGQPGTVVQVPHPQVLTNIHVHVPGSAGGSCPIQGPQITPDPRKQFQTQDPLLPGD